MENAVRIQNIGQIAVLLHLDVPNEVPSGLAPGKVALVGCVED